MELEIEDEKEATGRRGRGERRGQTAGIGKCKYAKSLETAV